MWFKNLQIYRLTESLNANEQDLHEALSQQAFSPCRGLDTHRMGWVPPLGKHGEQLVHPGNGRYMLCMRREDRILPAAVIREAVEEKVEAIASEQNRRVGRKERSEIKDEVIIDLLPRAFVKSILVYAYIDTQNDWIIVDSSSANRAEDLLSLLRESLGSLKLKPLTVSHAPVDSMTRWLLEHAPAGMQISDECELRDTLDDGGVIRMRGVDLGSQEVLQHLESGRYVARLALEWQERIGFVLCDDLSIKRLRFLDLVMQEAEDIEADDEAMRFDADFALMGMELARFIPALCQQMGGIDLEA
jgi:recombination associated protein RdgC